MSRLSNSRFLSMGALEDARLPTAEVIPDGSREAQQVRHFFRFRVLLERKFGRNEAQVPEPAFPKVRMFARRDRALRAGRYRGQDFCAVCRTELWESPLTHHGHSKPGRLGKSICLRLPMRKPYGKPCQKDGFLIPKLSFHGTFQALLALYLDKITNQLQPAISEANVLLRTSTVAFLPERAWLSCDFGRQANGQIRRSSISTKR